VYWAALQGALSQAFGVGLGRPFAPELASLSAAGLVLLAPAPSLTGFGIKRFKYAMKAISKFKLFPQKIGKKNLPANVAFAGQALHCQLAGSDLDAQFQFALGFLLISNESTSYEEALYFTLLSPNFTILDTLEMSHAYAPGSLRNLRITENDALEFTFFGGDNWRLSIFESPQRWPLKQLQPGVTRRWRRLLQKGYLSLTRLDLE